jgi:predicted RNA binding protein YcfA (HicA-like mRNA interferase family)
VHERTQSPFSGGSGDGNRGSGRVKLPGLKPAEVIRILERNGFRLLRSTKHRTYTDGGTPPRLVTVPYHNKDLKPKTLRSIIRQAGWTDEEFLKKM